MTFSTLAPQVCALDIRSVDEKNELGIFGMLVAAIPYREVDTPAFSAGGFYAFRSSGDEFRQVNGPLHFSRWQDGPIFPSPILFKHLTDAEYQDEPGSTNKDLESYGSIINTILDIGTRSWQIGILKQTRDSEPKYKSSYKLMIGSKQGYKTVDLFCKSR